MAYSNALSCFVVSCQVVQSNVKSCVVQYRFFLIIQPININNMSTVTGNEQVYPLMFDQTYDAAMKTEEGLTIRQLALKDFMCALITYPPEVAAERADQFVTAYINQLNKP